MMESGEQIGMAPAEHAFRRARRFWSWALLSPVGYLAAASLMIGNGWMPPPETFDFHEFAQRSGSLGLLAALAALTAFAMTQAWRRRRGAAGLDVWFRRFFWSLMCCDSLACAGLLHWLLTRRTEGFLAGSVAAYAAYACACPSRGETAGLPEGAPEEDE